MIVPRFALFGESLRRCVAAQIREAQVLGVSCFFHTRKVLLGSNILVTAYRLLSYKSHCANFNGPP